MIDVSLPSLLVPLVGLVLLAIAIEFLFLQVQNNKIV